MSLKDVQLKLTKKGFDPGPADGLWGPKTEKAIVSALDKLPDVKPVEPEVVIETTGENPYAIRDHRLFKGGTLVSWKSTPNLSPGVITPRLIVIHYTGTPGTESPLSWLTNPSSGVSAHLLLERTGKVWQLAQFNRRAWHAGPSEYDDGEFSCSDVNSHSIGIECVGTGSDWPVAQIRELKLICDAIEDAYDIVDIVGHDEIAVPAGRKSDPGKNFPWDKVVD